MADEKQNTDHASVEEIRHSFQKLRKRNGKLKGKREEYNLVYGKLNNQDKIESDNKEKGILDRNMLNQTYSEQCDIIDQQKLQENNSEENLKDTPS